MVFFSANRLMVVYICSNLMKIFLTIFEKKFQRGIIL